MDKTKRLVSAALLALTALAGCATVPAYQRPDAPLAPAYHSADALAGRAAALPAPALDSWWTGFDDPALQRIVARVLAQNLDLAAAMARVDQARAAARMADARLLPEGALTASAAHQRQSVNSPIGKIASSFPGYNREQSLYDAGLGASWELDVAGGLRDGAQAAGAEAQAAEADRLGVRVSVTAEAADAYFRVRGAQRRIALAREQIATNERLLELVRLRLADGLASSREVAQAEALVSQARATVPPLRIELEVQLNRLDVLMGAAPGTYAAELAVPGAAMAAGLAPEMRVPAISLSQGPADLLRRRPDVIAAERRLAASNAQIGAAMAEYYPKVTLSALLGLSSLGTNGLLTAASLQPQAAAGLRWRLFDFGRIDADVARAKGANAEALAAYRKAVLRAAEDVENAVVTLTQLEAQHTELAQEVDAHTRARDASELAYKGGAVSLYEVLDEQRQLLTSRDQLARVNADNARAAVATFRAAGGGW
ncbi:NodT family efflux transporter outer membrane factor (OMF) lipoprotein [Duganella sp. 1224]|uniref:efflux transporter outer membrane subunit n=1 Tax=Duganella sp. 1224 TaxID=2587052 RepID=UPI0015C6ABC9|nr:efflux transporter outer membrane subunit [Duganella sp. 1224]NYE64081.1 NodT family efflux transporter outer membrane factor (OMF) lipoprotein [Duganella sp. 1224]